MFFDKRCNDLEMWLLDRGYSDRMVRSQILKARAFSRDYLLNRERIERKENVLTLNITYHPALNRTKDIVQDPSATYS